MEAVKDANQLRDIQRINQNRQNFQRFTPNIATDFTGLKLPDQPDTLSMIRKNTDGTYGTDTGLDELNRTGKITGNKVGLIDPSKAPPPSAAAMRTNYNQFQNEVDRLTKKARATGITPNILTDSPPLTDQFFQYLGVDTPLGEGYIYKRDKDGRPISAIGEALGAEDEEQTRLGVVRYLQERDKGKPLGMVGMDDTDRYIEYGLPNMQPGAAANELQRRINIERQKDLEASQDFTAKEREALAAVNNMPTGTEEQKQAKAIRQRTVQDEIERRRNLDRLKVIEKMPDGIDKKNALDDFKKTLRGDITGVLEKIQDIKASNTSIEKIDKTFQDVNLSEANDAVRAAIQLRNETARLANIARIKGNEEEFNKYKTQLAGLDNNIIKAQGLQGLNDIKRGDTRRLTAALSNALGLNVQITPRDDGFFNVVGLGDQPRKMTAAQLENEGRLIFDREYKGQMDKLKIELYKKQFDTSQEIKKDLYKSEAELQQKILEIQGKVEAEKVKKGFTITKDVDDGSGDTMSVAEKDGQLFKINSEVRPDQEGKDRVYISLEPISGLGTGLYSTKDYVAATKPKAGVQQ